MNKNFVFTLHQPKYANDDRIFPYMWSEHGLDLTNLEVPGINGLTFNQILKEDYFPLEGSVAWVRIKK